MAAEARTQAESFRLAVCYCTVFLAYAYYIGNQEEAWHQQQEFILQAEKERRKRCARQQAWEFLLIFLCVFRLQEEDKKLEEQRKRVVRIFVLPL